MQEEQDSPFSTQTTNQIFKQEVVSLAVSPSQTCTFYKADYESLLPHRWLRTSPIDFLIKTLLERSQREICKIYASRGILDEEKHLQYVKMVDLFVVTMIMTYDDEAILKSLEGLQLFSRDTQYLLIPINTENANGSHWMLGCFRNGQFEGANTKSQLTMFDSGGSPSALGKSLKRKLEQLYKVLTEKELQIEVLVGKNIPLQTNNYDCGIFTVGFAEYILKEIEGELEENREIRLDRLKSDYKYLLGNSTMARERYRRMVEEKLRG